jgi:hypothetical protein
MAPIIYRIGSGPRNRAPSKSAYVEDHITGGIPDFSVGVAGTLVDELQELCVGFLCCG